MIESKSEVTSVYSIVQSISPSTRVVLVDVVNINHVLQMLKITQNVFFFIPTTPCCNAQLTEDMTWPKKQTIHPWPDFTNAGVFTSNSACAHVEFRWTCNRNYMKSLNTMNHEWIIKS